MQVKILKDSRNLIGVPKTNNVKVKFNGSDSNFLEIRLFSELVKYGEWTPTVPESCSKPCGNDSRKIEIRFYSSL